MGLCSQAIDGFLLAAAVAEDAAAEAAREGLTDGLWTALQPAMVGFISANADARRDEMRRIIALLRPSPAPARVDHARARAIVAREVPRAVGAGWLRDAPPLRRGFAATTGLRLALLRAGRSVPPRDQGLLNRHRGVGRESLAELKSTMAAADHQGLMDAAGPEEAAATMTLVPLVEARPRPTAKATNGEPSADRGEPQADSVTSFGESNAAADSRPPSPPRRHATAEEVEVLARVAARSTAARWSPAGQLTTTLGALRLGFEGTPEGAGADPWRRAGSEIREIEAGRWHG